MDDRGVSVQIEAGLPYVTIANPDNTKAYYKGLGVQGRGILPVIDTSAFSFNLVASAKYLDLTNTTANSRQKEIAHLIGPGAGASIMFFNFFAGMDYQFMFGRHYGIGSVSREMNYSFGALQTYYGVQWEFGAAAFGASYSSTTGSLPKSMTGLSVDSAYSESVYWLHFRYSTGFEFLELLKFLFH